jgi:hypothetical protein
MRSLFSCLVLVIFSITSCQSFVIHRGAAFTIRLKYELPEQESESAIPESESTKMTEISMGIDEEYIPFPHSGYTALDVVEMCMNKMSQNDEPYHRAGLEVCFNFLSDQCHAAQAGSLKAFIQFAQNPVFASMVNNLEWNTLSTGPIIPGTQTRGAMQTALVKVSPVKGEGRKFLWTLQQERRPPRWGYCHVYECIDVKNAYSQTL